MRKMIITILMVLFWLFFIMQHLHTNEGFFSNGGFESPGKNEIAQPHRSGKEIPNRAIEMIKNKIIVALDVSSHESN